jgi:hypothetical protein
MYAKSQDICQPDVHKVALFLVRLRLLRPRWHFILFRDRAATIFRTAVAECERSFAAFAKVPYEDVSVQREMDRLLDCFDEGTQHSWTHRSHSRM